MGCSAAWARQATDMEMVLNAQGHPRRVVSRAPHSTSGSSFSVSARPFASVPRVR